MSISDFKSYWSAHKWLRVTTYTVSTLCALSALLGIAINSFLNTKHLRPLVLKYADEYLDADVNLGSVDVTFFSTFPRVHVLIKDGEIISHAFHTLPTDTVLSRRDTLLRFETLSVGLNFNKFWTENKIRVGRLYLEKPTIRIVTDALGRRNWDIMKEDTTSVEVDTTEIDYNDYLKLRHIRINRGKFAYIDVPNKKSFRTDSLCANLDGELALGDFDADVELANRKTNLKVDGVRMLHNIPVRMNGHIACTNQSTYTLTDFRTVLGSLDMIANGDLTLVDDSTDVSSIDFNLDYALTSPDVKTLFDLIPQDVISLPINIEDGSVNFEGSVRGIYNDHNYPIFHTDLRIDGVKAQYEGMTEKVEDLSALIHMSIDDTSIDSSYIDMDILHFLGGKSELTAQAHLKRMFADPTVTARVDGHLDLESLCNIFPIQGLAMKGELDAKLGTKFKINEIKQQDFGHIVVGGMLHSDKLDIQLALAPDTIYIPDSTRMVEGDTVCPMIRRISEPDTFKLTSDLDIKFLDADTLRTVGKISQFSLQHPHIRIRLRGMEARTKTFKSRRDTTEIATAHSDVKLKGFSIRLDSIILAGRNVRSIVSLRPAKSNKRIPHFESKLYADTLFTRFFGTRSMTRILTNDMAFERVTDTTWTSNGCILFAENITRTPMFALPITASNTKIYQHGTTFDIKNMSLRTGESSLSVNGEMHNLYYSLVAKKPFNAQFNIKADTINVNQLLASVISEKDARQSNTMSDELIVDNKVEAHQLQVDSARIDSLANQLIYISKRIRFSLKTEANILLWSKLQLRNIKGNAEIINRTLHVTNFSFDQGSGKVISTFSYRPSRKRRNAQIDWFMRWERADIADLVKSCGIDTLMPMLQPFRGLVDCYMATQLTIDSTLTPDLSTARLAAHLGAQQATILDGDTFARLSKLLMFKNKKRNVIDTLSCNVLIDSGRVVVPPFTMSIDRYRACIGGEQDLDMNMKYHVSILKSPLPFKAGVDIFGTPDKIDFDVTKAKLKKYATPEIQAENDQKSLDIRLDILRHSYKMSGLPLPDQLKPKE